jgi:sRNA-binding carbon storage regulator CsrA
MQHQVSRKHGEGFTIFTQSGPVEILVEQMEGDQIKILINAPTPSRIYKNEVIAGMRKLANQELSNDE